MTYDIDEIIKLYTDGLSEYEIGLKFDISGQRISRILNNAKIETRIGGHGGYRSEVAEKHKYICKLYEKGISQNAIARKLNMSPAGVNYVIKKYF